MNMQIRLAVGFVALAAWGSLLAAEPAGSNHKVSFIPSANAAVAPSTGPFNARTPAGLGGDTLVFSAPPQESAEEAYRLYQPVAEYLSQTLGRRVTYVYPKTWLSYQKEAAQGSYDIVFDGAHFISWRISHLNHNAIAKLPEQQVFAVVTRADNAQLANLKQLAGKQVCSVGASNLATLALLGEFDPMRQPQVVEQVSWSKTYDGLIEGRCAAATMPLAVLRRLDGAGNATRVLHQTKPLPNQAFSAGPRVTLDEQARLTRALISADGKRALAPLLAANGSAQGLALTAKDDYAGMDRYLKDTWGYAR